MTTLDPGIIVADSDIATGEFNTTSTLLFGSVEVAQDPVTFHDFFVSVDTDQQLVGLVEYCAGADLTTAVDLGDFVVDRPLLSDSVGLADSRIDLQPGLSLQDAQAFEVTQAVAQDLVTATQHVDLAAFNRRLNVLRELQLVEQQDIVAIIPGTALDNFTYYLRGFNVSIEEFEYWSSVGFADIAGAGHLTAVCIVGVV